MCGLCLCSILFLWRWCAQNEKKIQRRCDCCWWCGGGGFLQKSNLILFAYSFIHFAYFFSSLFRVHLFLAHSFYLANTIYICYLYFVCGCVCLGTYFYEQFVYTLSVICCVWVYEFRMIFLFLFKWNVMHLEIVSTELERRMC